MNPSREDADPQAPRPVPGTEPEPEPEPAEQAICSAKGCRVPAAWALRWNNPKLHPPERRKTWTACDEHREYLGSFLSKRGFLREVEPLGSVGDE